MLCRSHAVIGTILMNNGQVAEASSARRAARPPGNKSLFRTVLGVASIVTMGSAVLIAVEQRRQTVSDRDNVCYSRAAAAAAIAATEISTNGISKANPAAKFSECDRLSGLAP
jgi:hypothetical protein